jgi:hypothetical protein
MSVAVAAAGEIAREIAGRTFPVGTVWIRELLDRRTRLALRFGFAGGGADHAVAVSIFYKPEPRLLGVPDLEANPQMIFADTRRLILAKNFYQSSVTFLIYSHSTIVKSTAASSRQRRINPDLGIV